MASLKSRLEAAKMTLDGERVRWLVGKEEVLTEGKNVFGEQLQKNRYEFIVQKAASIEYRRNLILSNLNEARTVHELHDLTDMPKKEIVEHIIALLRWRKIEQAGMKGRSPTYVSLENIQDG
ncbi:MAG: hypothetical protein OEV21_06740 [Thermoplasmata archaeon]|nr:hypothetical protein [Thermoplasmata archaeon]